MNRRLIFLLLLIGLPAVVRAQLPPAALNAGDPVDVEDENEFDQLLAGSLMPRHRWFTLRSDTQYLYSSNVLLLPDFPPWGEFKDSLVSQTVGLQLTPPVRHGIQVDGFLQHQLVRYDRHEELDYNAQAIGLQVTRPVADWLVAQIMFSANRWYLDRTDSEFFKMFDTRFSIWRRDALGKRVGVFYGYQLDWRSSTPAVFNRVDNAFYIGTRLSLLDRLHAQGYYQIGVQESLAITRTDVNHVASFSLEYSFCDNAQLAAFLRYTKNDSSFHPRDYGLFEGGGGLSLNVRL